MKKRTFLKCGLAALAVGAVGLNTSSVTAKKYGIAFDKVSALKKIDGGVTIRLDKTNILLIRVSDTEVHGFVAICTHEGCPVYYENKQIVCHCHGSRFNLDGQATRGPATKPLKKVPVSIDGARIIVGDI